MTNPFEIIDARLVNIENSLLSLILNQPSGKEKSPNEDFITENEASKEVRISKVTLSKWRKEGKIKFHRFGTRIRYKKSELLASLDTVKKYGRSDKKNKEVAA